MNKYKQYTVYIHKNIINDYRYIGITLNKPELRWGKDGIGYREQKTFYKAIQKYSWNNFEHIIVATDLTWEEACQKEQELIKYYNTYIGFENCQGYNMTLGGEGYILYEVDENKIWELWDKGYSRKEIVEKLGVTEYVVRSRLYKYDNYSKEEGIKRQQNLTKRTKCRKISQWTLDGKLIAHFDSAKEAEEKTGVSRKNISNMLRGINHTAGGYIWKYETDNIIRKNRQLGQYDKNHNLLHIYQTVNEAAQNGFSKSGIYNCCSGRQRTSGGYIWQYIE